MGSAVKVYQRIGLLLFLFSQWALYGFAQSGIITTYAGAGHPANGTQGTMYAIGYPRAVAADGKGGFYIACPDLNKIYGVAADGSIRLTAGIGTIGYSGDGGPATAAQLDRPHGVAVDSAGNLYIADSRNHRIRRVTPAGIISTVAGNGKEGSSGDGGQATKAKLSWPSAIAADSAGNLYILHSNPNYKDLPAGTVRKVTAAGIISTVAGNDKKRYRGDKGQDAEPYLYSPYGIAADSAGNLYIAAAGLLRKVTTTGILSTVAGNGRCGFSGDGGQATAAQLACSPYSPSIHIDPATYTGGVAVDSTGNLYIADSKNHRIRKVTPAGVISTVAGNGTKGYSGDGGLATEAQLDYPIGLAVDSAGNLYIADFSIHRIRKVTPAGIISTVAGNGTLDFSGDGGMATAAQFGRLSGLTVDSAGNLYIVDSGKRIRKITSAGIISTVAGKGTDGYGDGGAATKEQSEFSYYQDNVAVDSAGNLYITGIGDNRIRKVTPAGIITTVAGNGIQGYSGDGGPATEAQLNGGAMAVDSAGNLYIADCGTHRVRKVTAAGIISTAVGSGSYGYSRDGGLATEARLGCPSGLAIDSAGNLYIADSGNRQIYKVTPSGIISTVAGNGADAYGGDGGAATTAQLNAPLYVTVDSAGNIYIADTGNHRVRKVTPDGKICTVAGNGKQGYSGDGGLATEAKFYSLSGIAVDSAGNLYIADPAYRRIRKVTP
jgi:trimeric autotransporter adhesin